MRLGTWLTVPHPTVIELISTPKQLEWICVDLEHSPVSRLDLQLAVSIIQGQGKKAFARVNENRTASIRFALDAGVDGIIVPMVNSREETESVINSCFYPPIGMRPVGLARAQKFGFGFENHLKKNREQLEVIVQVEHVDAVANIDEILSVERLAGVFLGPYDLSGSMGIPGEFDNPRMKEAINRVASKTIAAGKILGAHVIEPDYQKVLHYRSLGYNFIAFSIDTFFLGKKLNEQLDHLSDVGRTK